MVGAGGVLITRIRCGAISLQFEGSWMPLTGVLRSVSAIECWSRTDAVAPSIRLQHFRLAVLRF